MNAFKTQYYSRRFLDRFLKRLPSLKRTYLNSVPAIHLKPLDWYDYVMRFSSELLVLILALGVAGLNLFHFYAAPEYSDKSFAAKFLSYHPGLNKKLYEKNTTITTQIVTNRGLIPLAQAEDFASLDASSAAEETNYEIPEAAQSFAGDILVQPNQDTLSSLIAKQIKVYKTASGDTLSKIAQENGITIQTLMWANHLASETIKPGWFLVILPTNGVLHKATSNDTLPDIAKKYNVNLETIIAFNGLETAEDIFENQIIVVPGGILPENLRPKPPATSSNSGKVSPGGTVKPRTFYSGTGHLFPWGYCTWYVASKVHVPWGGNAKNWLANARAYGAVTNSEPAIGAIVVTTDNKRYGHVALITAVDDRGFTVSEMNYEAFGRVNTRWINKNSSIIRGFIYP